MQKACLSITSSFASALRGVPLSALFGLSAVALSSAQDRSPVIHPGDATYYVDRVSGDDGNDGRTEASAFATIQAAASAVAPGETVAIKRGVYRETVTAPTSGEPGASIVFRSHGLGEVVLSGGERITGWTRHDGDIWAATVDWDANGLRENNTLFVNGELSYEARHFAETDLLDIDGWGQLERDVLRPRFLRAPSLVGYGDDYWNGAKVTFHVNDWTITTRDIVDYHSDAGRIRFDPRVEGILLKQTCGFYFHDTILALDRPGEWFKDPSADVLYYHAEPGQDPNELRIEFKRRGYGFDLRGRSHVTVQGMTFRGVTLQMDGGTDDCMIEGNVFYGYGKGNGNGFDRMSLVGDRNVFR
ncbi:MAG: carbohydrate-binding CenC domain protein, partial [Planctomycetota bacterium]